MPHVSYLGTTNSKQIKEALRVAYTSHKHQKRKSGEPFIIHPIEVAILLTSLSMDAETIMAGLLHDTVEDTELTFSQIEIMFGHTVKSIVEGETKVSKLPRLEFNNYADEQAENLRQMFVAMTDDYRIIIVKLADRLHNMRTLEHMKPEKQQKISKETLDIFAPLAHRMGIWQFKSELEDISFQYLYPKEYRKITRMLRKHATKLNETLDYSRDKLDRALRENQVLQEQAVSVKVVGRHKELYSLYYKMQTMGEEELDHIKDVVGLRVIIEPKKPKDRSIGSSSGSETLSVNGSSATASLGGSGSTANGLKEGGSDIDDDLDNHETDWGVWLCYHVLGVVQHLPGFQPVPTKVRHIYERVYIYKYIYIYDIFMIYFVLVFLSCS
jgi:(p)ppGpp synthase/HD superfamily hydrolase